MSEPTETSPDDPVETLRTEADALRRELEAVRAEGDARLLRAELKAEAVRAGIVDLDGLRLLDPRDARLTETGEVENGPALMAAFRRAKPWLFAAGASSASAATPPPAHPPHAKTAMQMTDAEYRAARAELLKRRT